MKAQLLVSALEARVTAWQSSVLLCSASYHGSSDLAERLQSGKAPSASDRRQHEPYSIIFPQLRASAGWPARDRAQDHSRRCWSSAATCSLDTSPVTTNAIQQSHHPAPSRSPEATSSLHPPSTPLTRCNLRSSSLFPPETSHTFPHPSLRLSHALHTSPCPAAEPPLQPPSSSPTQTVTVATGSLFADGNDDDDGSPEGLIPPPPVEDDAAGISEAQQQAEAVLRAAGNRMLREVRAIFTWCLRIESTPEGQPVEAAPGEPPLGDEEVRRVLRFALGTELTKTQGDLELALGRADGEEVRGLLEQLIQITDDGVVTFKQLLQPDAPMAFLEAILVMKLRLEGVVPDTPDAGGDAEAAAATPRIAPDALHRAFQLLQSVDGVVSLQELAATDRLIDDAAAAGTQLSYALLLREEGPPHFIRAMLQLVMQPVSDDIKDMALDIMHEESVAQLAAQESSKEIQDDVNSDSLLMFLTQHIDLLHNCPPEKRDTLLLGLLDIYLLQRIPVVREFIPPAPGELPPEVAHSPMKPLGQEISHRVQMLINLYPPQRVAWGAYVDLSKVMRPLRAKNHAKRLKYKDYKDIYYSED
eukprot:jgi/Ulvmu1/5783/UM025_0037.1